MRWLCWTKRIQAYLKCSTQPGQLFLYMKEIVKGESYVMLSQEEVEALRKAVNFGLDNIEE